MDRKKKIILIAVFVPLLLALSQGLWFRRSELHEGNPVIEMTAENFKFTPAEIRVRAGARVTLKVRALDDKHGIAFKLLAEGQPEGSAPGLRFATPAPDWTLKKGEEKVIEFVAERPGRYEFACSVFCGMGHNAMLGRIIVE